MEIVDMNIPPILAPLACLGSFAIFLCLRRGVLGSRAITEVQEEMTVGNTRECKLDARLERYFQVAYLLVCIGALLVTCYMYFPSMPT